MVASDRQVMYWAPDKKTAVALKCLSTHSAVGQSFTIRYCTGRSGAPLIGSCHISASVTKQVCCKRSCPGVPVWIQAEVTHFGSQFPLKFVVAVFFVLKKWDDFRFNFEFSGKELLP